MELNFIIENIIESIMDVSEKFYRQQNSRAYEKLDELFIQFGYLLNNEKVMQNDVIKNNIMDISKLLSNVMEALKEKDGVLIADILKYDIGDRILNILDAIGEQNWAWEY